MAARRFCRALNPYWAIHFFLEYKVVSLRGARHPLYSLLPVLKRCMQIWGTSANCRFAWRVFLVVLPSFVLNYFGQGAAAENPEAIKTFFLLALDWALVPMLILATLATVIASQAVISSVFL